MGIMVGRGTAPVKFDTHKFQKRLETIANEFGEKKGTTQKIDLKFYDVLDNPVPEEGVPPQKKPLEIIPRKEAVIAAVANELKTSKKKQTFIKQGNTTKTDSEIKDISKTKVQKSEDIKTQSVDLKKSKASELLSDPKGLKGNYTLQIAAYKDFKDAVTHMAILEKKGFSSYRVKGEKDGVTWYRIRSGSFETYDAAKKFKEKLKSARINSMIIKRDKDDDIKR
ncbi:MAG: SPOR domain-containing protein [Proteobacteria bacterium]|nr:SPOR domain-containing protein [Pseudomonadota bacterium]MBU1586229.1 SPOR domain-containing protein [Pseudomonadota bacterium]MBU2628735.1 SPOR domain-containing protein [Pseudomonadota bacterium]